MADPTTTTTAAWAVTAGLMGAFLTSVGVTWPVVFYACLGALVGGGAPVSVGRAKAMAIFPATVLLSAKAGLASAAWLGAIGGLAGAELAQAMAGGIAMVFHPLAATATRLIPALAAKHFGIQPPEAP